MLNLGIGRRPADGPDTIGTDRQLSRVRVGPVKIS
jgi:hypothetical protein